MKANSIFLLITLIALMSCQSNKTELTPWTEGAFETRQYRNLFAEAGYPQADIDARLNQIFYNLFEGPDKVYFEVGDSNYDGSPRVTNRIIGEQFRFDSWRVPMNIALDYSWACADREWQQQYGHKIQDFLYSQGVETFVDQYNIDGTQVADILEAGGYKALRHSLGLVATSAAVSLVCTHAKSLEFVHHFWNSKHEPYQDGYFDAYYDGLLQLFAFMHLSGNYRIIFPRG